MTERHTTPLVDRRRLAELAARAEREATRSPRPTSPRGRLAASLTEALAQDCAEPRVWGSPEPRLCPDCGGEVSAVLRPVTRWLAIWEREEHSCSQREARLAREAEERRKARDAWIADPPPERIAEIRDLVRLPVWTPAGLDRIRRDEVSVEALVRLIDHRQEWVAGRRPERGVWLVGRTDRRKTTLLCALAFDVAHRTRRLACYWAFEDLMEQLRRAASDRPHAWDPVRVEGADLLVLDDIGAAKPTERAVAQLYELVAAAYDGCGRRERQTLYVATNERPEALVSLLALPERPEAGARIVRRLVQLCEVIQV